MLHDEKRVKPRMKKILNVHTFNNSTSEQIKQKLLKMKGDMDTSTIIPGDFNITHLAIDLSKKTINIENLNNTINQHE